MSRRYLLFGPTQMSLRRRDRTAGIRCGADDHAYCGDESLRPKLVLGGRTKGLRPVAALLYGRNTPFRSRPMKAKTDFEVAAGADTNSEVSVAADQATVARLCRKSPA